MPKARRHNEIVISYSLSLLVMIGPSAYKLIHANMPEAFPSLSTMEREASKRYHPLKEGEFLFDKLAAHLDAYTKQLELYQSRKMPQEWYLELNMMAAVTVLLALSFH